MLIAFRILQGLGGALMMPGTLAILRSTFPTEQLQMAIGIWAGASSVSIASGPIVGGLLVEHVDWQSIFFINLGVGLVALAIGAWVIEETWDEQEQTISSQVITSTNSDLKVISSEKADALRKICRLVKTPSRKR